MNAAVAAQKRFTSRSRTEFGCGDEALALPSICSLLSRTLQRRAPAHCVLLHKPRKRRRSTLRTLRGAHKPDFHKNVIPAGATDGSMLWIRMDSVPVMRRLVAIPRHKGSAAAPACARGVTRRDLIAE